MLIPTVNEIELLTGEAIAAVEIVRASEYLWPVEGFTEQLAAAYRQDATSIDAAFSRARDGEDQVPNLVRFGMFCELNARPLINLLDRMHRLEASLRACNKCPVFTSLHDGENQNYEFLDFVQQHTAKERPHRYLVWDGNEEQCCAFLTAHEVAFWWLSWVRNFEHYCQSRLFNPKSGWWLKEPADLCARLEMDAKNYSKAPRLDSENLKELIRDESMAMLSTIRGNHWNRRAGINVTEWLTSPARFDVDEIEVFIDHDGWPKLDCKTESLTTSVETQCNNAAQEPAPEKTVDNIPRVAVTALPFGLQECDVPQTLKRKGYKPVPIRNEDAWKLMEALMGEYPHAVPESKLNHLFSHGPDQRKNARKALVACIDSLSLTVKKWVLTEMER